MRFFLLLVALVIAGCGYHFSGRGGTLPGGIEQIHIPLFENLTREPQLENQLTNEVIEIFSRQKNIRQVPFADAEAVLSGKIRSYDSRALSYSQDDQISKYRASMTIEVRLQRKDTQELLWDGTLRWQTEYDAAPDKMLQGDEERLAQDELARRLAEELYSQILDDF